LEDEELQSLVKRASLRYLDGTHQGEVITKANIYDEHDPFFEHRDFNLWLEMGHKNSSEANSIEKIVLSNFINRQEVESYKNRKTKYRGITKQWEVVTGSHDQDLKNEETEMELDASVLLKTSNTTKKLKLCAILHINANKDMEEKT